jgi:hypothetical protein
MPLSQTNILKCFVGFEYGQHQGGKKTGELCETGSGNAAFIQVGF